MTNTKGNPIKIAKMHEIGLSISLYFPLQTKSI